MKAVLFDLFETLITESARQPEGVSSLAPEFGCERNAFRARWRELRPEVMAGRLSFRDALATVAAALGGKADEATLRRATAARTRMRREAFVDIEAPVLLMLDHLRSRGVRLGVVSNGAAEDLAAWPECALRPRVDCAVFSCEVGLVKPDPRIYTEAVHRIGVDAADAWFIGDGCEELEGAERAGLRAFQARWFLRRWPQYRDAHGSGARIEQIEDVVPLVERALPGTTET